MSTGEKIKEVLKKAEEIMPDFDTIIDIFDMSFIYVSEESARIAGYTPEEMINEPIHQFMNIPATDGESFQNVMMKTMVGGNIEIPIKKKDGREMRIIMNFKTIEIDNHPFIVTKAAGK